MEAGIVLPPSPETESLDTIFSHVTLRRWEQLTVKYRPRIFRKKLINRTWFPGLLFAVLLAAQQVSAAGSSTPGLTLLLGGGPDSVMVADSSEDSLVYHIDVGNGLNTVAITDKGGADVYTIIGSAASIITITDGPGADTYEFIGIPAEHVYFWHRESDEDTDNGNIVTFQ